MRLAAPAIIYALTSLAVLVAPAQAGAPETFLEGVNGKWRGGGTLFVGAGEKQTKVRCSLRNEMEGEALKLIGRCASSAGTRPLRGELVPRGTDIAASSLKLPGAGTLRDTSASLSGDTLTISGTLRDGGKSVPVRNTITRSDTQLMLSISAEENGAWTDRGTIIFRR